MAKKKQEKATITKPKVGKWYTFTFAGGSLLGILEERNDKLTQHYGVAWFWMRVPADKSYSSGGHEVRDVRYPVSIYNLIAEQNVQ
jgi:hypothetical protein